MSSNGTEVINIGVARSSSPLAPPRLNVTGAGDHGTIKLNNLPQPVELGTPTKSVNFGPGASLLMNQDRMNRSSSPKSDIKLSDLKILEHDLGKRSMSKKDAQSALLNAPPATVTGGRAFLRPVTPASITAKAPGQTANPSPRIKLNVEEMTAQPAQSSTPPDKNNLGSSTAKASGKDATWDGYKTFNEIPVDPNLTVPEKPKMTPEETLREKFRYMRRLEALSKKGIAVSRKYTMDDSLAEMKGEYEMIKSDMEKSNSVKFQGKMLMAAVSAIEFLNSKFDPLDIKLDGWGDSINENINEYDDVFGELHQKYGGKAKMAPELKLLFMLGGSAVMVHMTNTMFKSAMPGMDDIMRQNPELMQQFTQAAVSSMGQRNPGLGGFMSGVMGQPPPPMGSPPGPPPHMRRMPPRMNPGGPLNRPDIGMARGVPIFDDAENMESSAGRVPPRHAAGAKRADMQGPRDISDILSNIKTKRVNIKQSADAKSTISVEDLQREKADVPHKSKRKPRSERNTVNLQI